MRQECKAVVFDMDGVIFDTERLVQKCWRVVADKYGIPDIEEACLECLGLNQAATIERFQKRYGEDFPYAEYKTEMRGLFFGEFYGEHLPIKKGARELLQALKEHQIPIALASSTRSEVVIPELTDAGLLPYFDQVICGDMVSHSKPDPEIFLTACEKLGVKPEDAYGIEDSFNGIRAVAAGHLHPIMVPDMIQPTDEIRGLTEVVCEDLLEVIEYLGL